MTMFESYLKAQQLDRTMLKDSSGFNCYHAMASLTEAIVNLVEWHFLVMQHVFTTFLWKRPQKWWCIFHWHG